MTNFCPLHAKISQRAIEINVLSGALIKAYAERKQMIDRDAYNKQRHT
jgi:hypothetical protein